MKKNPTFLIVIALFSLLISVASADESYRLAILHDDLPGHDLALSAQIEKTLSDCGYAPDRIDAQTLCDADRINTDRYDLLVLPNAASLPQLSIPVIESFLRQGGDLLALNAPAYSQLLWRSDNQWFSDNLWRKQLTEIPTENRLFDFESENLTQWHRSSNTPEAPATYEISSGYQGNGLHVHVPNMAGWDTFSTPALNNPFPEGHSLLCFYAKGTEQTRTLSVECIEQDGSRWIAVFPITPEWSRIVLTPGDFQFWKSVPDRGQSGDRLNPKNIVRMQIGVAWTHTGPRGGDYEYWIDEIGTAANPYGDMPREVARIPRIEGVSPSYKFYSLSDVAKISPRWAPLQSIAPTLSIPKEIQAHHPRPTGKGYDKDRGWRWIPLLEAFGSQGEWRGAPASLFIDSKGPLLGSTRACFSVGDPEWYKQPAVQQILATVVERMSQGIFLLEAGSQYFTYHPNEPVILGAELINDSPSRQETVSVLFDIADAKSPQKTVTRHREEITLAQGETRSISWTLPQPSSSEAASSPIQSQWIVNTHLIRQSKDIDTIPCEWTVYEPKPDSQRQFITTQNGDFILDGKKWYVHGVNYMPSTGIGIENQANFEYWIDKPAYDPEFIQRDLERCLDLGLNSISIFIYHRSIASRNLLDILLRCQRLGLKVNLSIRPGTPMQYQWNQWKEIIEAHRLWEWDTIYTYDIAWEPFFGTEPQRREYDPQWLDWINKKYGSVPSAEQVWGISAPRLNNRVTSPSAQLLGKDGDHRKMIADYRQFVDELIQDKYQNAADRIRTLDPHHLISFRMTVAGDPTFLGDENMPYDFQAVAQCMDYLAPEGYGRIGDWNRIKPGMFTVAYARYCAPEKPVLWAEAGVHAWDNQAMRSDPALLDYQGRFYENFYRMLLQSYSNGIVWWWYAGGLRANEQSDYGIINPDGSDRPNSKIIRQYASKILAERTIPQPDIWIPIDRDADARGLYGIYEKTQEDFWKAIDSGKFPALK